MPLSKYYGGHGEKVMAFMRRTYGDKAAERVFYATQNKRKRKLKKHSKTSRPHKDASARYGG